MEIIGLKGVHKSYTRGASTVEVLRGIDLAINPAETVAIVGASGVGKSTLLNIMGALDHTTGGEVHFNGKLSDTLDESSMAQFRNRSVGFVFQSHHLLPEFSAVENVMLPALIGGTSRDEATAKAEELLGAVGLGHRLSHKPGELSGGEQQRTAIVRALIQNPDVVLADEPTGNLDTVTAEEVFDLLLKMNRERETALVVVTHNETLAGKLSRTIRMVDGTIVEEQ
jgi:lipoprotein-releasing system ATP-binding protein